MPPRRSVERASPNGRTLRFSSRADFVDWLIEKEEIASEADLRTRPTLYAQVFDEWVAQAQLGCIFAVRMVRKDHGINWTPVVIQESDPQRLHEQTNLILLNDEVRPRPVHDLPARGHCG